MLIFSDFLTLAADFVVKSPLGVFCLRGWPGYRFSGLVNVAKGGGRVLGAISKLSMKLH